MLAADIDLEDNNQASRRSTRNRKQVMDLSSSLADSSSNEEESESEGEFLQVKGKSNRRSRASRSSTDGPIIELPPRSQSKLPDSQERSGRVLFEQLTNGGMALKLVIGDWMNLFDSNPTDAACQLLNFVIWVSDVHFDMDRDDLEHGNPAAVLAELQEEWVPVTGVPLLSTKVKSKQAKSLKQNYGEFWSKWAATVLPTLDEGVESVIRQLLGWLMTMTSSNYRSLRASATSAALGIMRGCCQSCALLNKELDQANRLAAGKRSKSTAATSGSSLVDSISKQVASLEKIVQMIFDGVFVQRFRDVDPLIRITSLEYLTDCIIAYPEVFLDNSYLRYIGWAMSDRHGSVREAALEAFQSVARDGGRRHSMESFMARFTPRLLEMAEADVDVNVRNEACKLLAFMYTHAADREEFREGLKFVHKVIKSGATLSNEMLTLITRMVYLGEHNVDRYQMIKDREFGENAPMEAIIGFVAEMTEMSENDERFIWIESFVNGTKRVLPVLKDFFTWQEYAWRTDMSSTENNFIILTLIEAVARFSFVYVNTPYVIESSRCMKDGISLVHSVDLAKLITKEGSSLVKLATIECFEGFDAFYDLLSLADARTLLETCPTVMDDLSKMPVVTRSEVRAWTGLVRYWQKEFIPGAEELIVETIQNDVQSVLSANVNSIKVLDELSSKGTVTRLRYFAAYFPINGWPQVFEKVSAIATYIQVICDENGDRDSYKELLRDIVHLISYGSITSAPEMGQDALCFVVTILKNSNDSLLIQESLTCLHHICSTLKFIIGKVEQRDILQKLDIVTDSKSMTGLFILGKMFLEGWMGEEAIILLFSRFHQTTLTNVVVRCYNLLWYTVVIKCRKDTLGLAVSILKASNNPQLYKVESFTSLLKIIVEGVKGNAEAKNVESLMKIFDETDCPLWNEHVLPVFATLLSPNLASEVLLSMSRKGITCQVLIKALERAASVKKSHPVRSVRTQSRPGVSRLREVLGDSVADSNDSDNEDNDDMSGGVRRPETPVNEMQELRMSSEMAMPSSPLQVRKRVIRQ